MLQQLQNKDYEGRKALLVCLVGSHNYNLNTEDSDKDYKVFVAPTFDDLYQHSRYVAKEITKDRDYEVHDIRKLPILLRKANLAYLEILFSKEYWVEKGPLETLFKEPLRTQIITMNMPAMFSCCMGNFDMKVQSTIRQESTEGTRHLVARYGYDTKQAMHAYRNLDFLERFAVTGFRDFDAAMTYLPEERDTLLNIKNGGMKILDLMDFLRDKSVVAKELERRYKDNDFNEAAAEQMDTIVMDVVKCEIAKELKECSMPQEKKI